MDFDSMDERSVSTAHVRVAVRDINVSDDYCNLRLKYHIGSVLPSPLSPLPPLFLLSSLSSSSFSFFSLFCFNAFNLFYLHDL